MRTLVHVDQVLEQTFDLVRAIPSPETIVQATATVVPDDGGCVPSVVSTGERVVLVEYSGVRVGAYDTELTVETSQTRTLVVCLPIVVLARSPVPPVALQMRPGTKENYGFNYALRMKENEALLEASALVPAELVASFAVDPNNTQQVLGTIEVPDSTAAGIYVIDLTVTTNLSQPFIDRLLIEVEDCSV